MHPRKRLSFKNKARQAAATQAIISIVEEEVIPVIDVVPVVVPEEPAPIVDVVPVRPKTVTKTIRPRKKTKKTSSTKSSS